MSIDSLNSKFTLFSIIEFINTSIDKSNIQLLDCVVALPMLIATKLILLTIITEENCIFLCGSS